LPTSGGEVDPQQAARVIDRDGARVIAGHKPTSESDDHLDSS